MPDKRNFCYVYRGIYIYTEREKRFTQNTFAYIWIPSSAKMPDTNLRILLTSPCAFSKVSK